MSGLVWLFAILAVSEVLTDDPERAVVAAILALTCAVMRLRPGWLAREFSAKMREAEGDQPPLFKGE